MNKLQPIICLPTDKASELFLNNLEVPQYKLTKNKDLEDLGFTNQFLYILSSEPIKEGDWCMGALPYKIKDLPDVWDARAFKHSKIIATSNPELHVDLGHVCLDQLPQLPLSLIEHYAKYQPKEVMVEYERICDQCFNDDSDDGCYCHHGNYKTIDKLKLTPSGEICWSPVVDSGKVKGVDVSLQDIIDKRNTPSRYNSAKQRYDYSEQDIKDILEDYQKQSTNVKGVDVDELGYNYYKSNWCGIKQPVISSTPVVEAVKYGYNQALQSSDKMFSLEDMKEAVQRGIEIGIGNYVPEYRDEEGDLRNTNPKITEDVKEYIQSLTKEQ
jgi:hypothetical protein